MRQLLKDQFKNFYWMFLCLIILGMCLFSGCAANKGQKVNDATLDASQEKETITGIDSKATANQAIDKRAIKNIKLLQHSDSLDVIIIGNEELKYTSIKQSFPFGIAIYLPDTLLAKEIAPITPENNAISNIISSYADKDKKTAKIEILLSKDLAYDIKKEDDTLRVTLQNEDQLVKTEDKQRKTSIKDSTVTKPVQIPSSIAKLSNIEFTVEDSGNTELTLTTSHPVNYDFSKGNKGILYLNLYKTNIPSRHTRPFETKYFKSAVQRVIPIQKQKNGKNSKIEINMREKVPYQVTQENNIITVRFEPSSIEPPKFAKAEKTIASAKSKKPAIKTQQAELESQGSVQYKNINIQPTNDNIKTDKPSIVKTSSKQSEKPNIDQQKQKITNPAANQKKYIGEKIKLDFYETDIKNVFRILSSISNKNFAIDKDVTGSVTLTLDNPIPWDQVLDLVLSMNQLDKIENGSVIRIATQETLSNEAKQRHTQYEAMRKVEEEKKALEPLITEYIPINYANAASDILPHIKNILTEDRGTASVDERTNMIIVTDTKEIVEKAKNLIYTLDNVTPQIMIAAKIVEANKEFSRDFGLGLSFGFDENGTSVNDDYDVSLNAPATSASPSNTASFTFNNLMGGHGENIFAAGNAFLTATLNASESKGDISVLSSPKILTLDNKKAKIKQGLEYPYIVIDADGNATVEFKDIDLLLEVTPHVTPDKRIAMEIFVTKNEIAGEFVLGVPPVSTNEATTTLLVNNNDTIVIGGVLKSYQKDAESGFPFLMNIPLLGRFFRTDTSINDKKELLIFLTPTIVQLKQKKNELKSESDLSVE